jgi:hypothetical protein
VSKTFSKLYSFSLSNLGLSRKKYLFVCLCKKFCKLVCVESLTKIATYFAKMLQESKLTHIQYVPMIYPTNYAIAPFLCTIAPFLCTIVPFVTYNYTIVFFNCTIGLYFWTIVLYYLILLLYYWLVQMHHCFVQLHHCIVL